MAEGRFVSKSIATDYELNCVVSFEADYLFRACIPFIDRDGRLTGHPGEVKAKVCPLRANMTLEVVDACLGELARAGLVLWYEVDGKPALWFKGFTPHQKGLRAEREAASRLPSQQDPNLKRLTTVLRTNSGELRTTPAEVKASEVKASQEQPQRVDVVEKSIPEYAKPPEYSRFELLDAAKRECGMGRWNRKEESTANSVIVSWQGEGKSPGEIWGVIHGARLLVDRGQVDWLAPKQPFGLQAIRNTFTLADQGDGRSQRPFFDVALEEYVRDDDQPRRGANTGPVRVRVDPLQALGGSSA